MNQKIKRFIQMYGSHCRICLFSLGLNLDQGRTDLWRILLITDNPAAGNNTIRGEVAFREFSAVSCFASNILVNIL